MDPEHLKKVPNGAAGLFLLGQVRELQQKNKEAIRSYVKALKIDPTLWCAFERLCALKGDDVEPQKFFTKDHPYMQSLNMALQDEDAVKQALISNQGVAGKNHAICSPQQNQTSNQVLTNNFVGPTTEQQQNLMMPPAQKQ